MPENKPSLSRDDFVRVALEFVNDHDMSELTIRALGKQLGVDATALYRHFPKKENLLDAMLEDVLSVVADTPDLEGVSPRDCAVNILWQVRSAFRNNPNLSTAFVAATGDYASGFTLTRRICKHLLAAGVPSEILVRTYQMLEGYTMGTSVFDAGGAPATWTVRQVRYRQINMPEFDALATDSEHVKQVSDEAFLRAINIIIDDAVAQANK